MVLSEEEDQLHKKLLDLCSKLNLDQKTISIAWDNFTSINKNVTLEGDALQWLGCAIFVASQIVEVSTVSTNPSSPIIKGSGINLKSLLRHSNLSFVQFFTNINLWADMANLSEEFKSNVNRLEDNFNVASSTFKKYCFLFSKIFIPPNLAELEASKHHRNRKLRPVMCNSSRVFEFIWNLFITLKAADLQYSTELVKSFHLLFACLDLAFKNAFLSKRRDLLNPNFECLPPNWNHPDFVSPSDAPCLIGYFCKEMVTEAMHTKVYDLKILIGNLISNKVLTADSRHFTGLFDQNTFESNFKNVVNTYDAHLLNTVDVDEKLFLAEYRRRLLEEQQSQINFEQSIKTSPMSYSAECSVITSPQYIGRNGIATPRAPDTPLTGRSYLPREADTSPLSVDKFLTQKITRLHNILNNRSPAPSEYLLKVFESCRVDPTAKIQDVLNNLSEKFVAAYTNSFQNRKEDAKTMVQYAITLFYKFIENILKNEKKIRTDISDLVQKDIFYMCMFTCCMEIVLFSHNFPLKFPWILEVFDIQPLHFVKVIELIVRSGGQLSREIIKYLNKIEETVLESLMWKSNSLIWEAINNSGEIIPKFEETALPGQLVYSAVNGNRSDSTENLNTSEEQPVPSALERFQSPNNRQLFPNISAGQSLLIESNPYIPRRPGSLPIIFRKFYNLAGIRMEHLCIRLGLLDSEVKQKIWTAFEHSIQNSDLIRDRHLDQLLMCAVYVICKLTNSDLKFQDIMKFYRDQPQSSSDVYRHVLITRQITNEGGVTIPEDRSDLIKFYNSVYVEVMRRFVSQFRSMGQRSNLLLSPLPAVKRDLTSSSVQVVGNVFVRRFESPSTGSSDSFNYVFNRSPSKDLKDINKLVNNSRVAGKRLLIDGDLDKEIPPNKRLSNRKVHTLVEERRNQNAE